MKLAEIVFRPFGYGIREAPYIALGAEYADIPVAWLHVRIGRHLCYCGSTYLRRERIGNQRARFWIDPVEVDRLIRTTLDYPVLLDVSIDRMADFTAVSRRLGIEHKTFMNGIGFRTERDALRVKLTV